MDMSNNVCWQEINTSFFLPKIIILLLLSLCATPQLSKMKVTWNNEIHFIIIT